MVNNYQKGYMLEWRCKKMLEERGWMALRSPASRDVADVFATKEGKSLLIQAKKTSKKALYVYGLNGLLETAKKYKAKPLLVYSFYYTPIYVKEVKNNNEKVLKKDEHLTLEEYLKF